MAIDAGIACRIEPLPPQPPSPREKLALISRDSAGQLFGCLMPLIAVVVYAAAFMLDRRAGCGAVILVMPLVLLATLLALVVIRERKLDKLQAAKVAANELAAQREAQDLARSAWALLDNSQRNAQRLPQLLGNTSGWLIEAQNEYSQTAFGPFWDAVDNAAMNLAEFRDLTQQLADCAASYYRMLSGRSHTFPVFPIAPRALPDPALALTELRRIIRLGQTNYHFADIWEQRKTRAVLKTGFRNLGEALTNLTLTVDGAMDALKTSISSDMARSLDEQVRSREASAGYADAQLKKLDQIHSQLEGRSES